MRGQRAAVFVTGLLALAFCCGMAGVALLDASGGPGAAWLHRLYSPLCHQIPGRSLTIGAGHFPLCARCTGLYAGGTLGLLLGAWLVLPGRLVLRPAWLLVSLAPLVADVGARGLGLAGLPNLPRALASLPAGGVAGMLLGVGVGDWYEMWKGPIGDRTEDRDA